MRVLHVINDLYVGGAEMMLLKLLSATDRSRFEPYVISLMDKGALGQRIEETGVPVYAMNMLNGAGLFGGVWRFMRTVRRINPHIIQGWMYHGNIAALAARATSFRRIPILGNIRHSVYDIRSEHWLTQTLIRLGARLSTRYARIIFNSRISAKQHEALGYTSNHMEILPNGFDCDEFKPSAEARINLRKSLELPLDAALIGLIARFHPMKGHENFINAAKIFAERNWNVHFVLAGRAVDPANKNLMSMILKTGFKDRLHLLGERDDIPMITSGLDIASSSSSYGEGFPNVVGEAMACGVPCVVTDVGDSRWLAGDTGIVVPPGDPQAMAQGWKRLLDLSDTDRIRLGESARERIIKHFTIEKIVDSYEDLYMRIYNERYVNPCAA